jgi:hypothetical protein
MKIILAAAALLAGSVPAFADHTKFVAPPPKSDIQVQRAPNPYLPYSRSLPRAPVVAPTRPTTGAAAGAAERFAPYNRSNARVPSTRA